MLADDVRASLRAYPDFPTRGVLFQDMAPLLRDPVLVARVIDAMAAPFEGRVDAVAGIESRGFVLGALVAAKLRAPFIPVRKAGKLPGETIYEKYELEYGTAALEMQRDALAPRARVVIVDDVLATGGTASAAARLVEATGADVVGYSFLLEIGALPGRSRLAAAPAVIARV